MILNGVNIKALFNFNHTFLYMLSPDVTAYHFLYEILFLLLLLFIISIFDE